MLAAAEVIFPMALDHGMKLLGDPAVVTTALEEVAATVSRTRKVRDPVSPLQGRDLRAYLFRAFLRYVDRLKRKELVVISLDQMPHPPWADVQQQFDNKILLDECLTGCDPITQDMASRRMQRFSWEEIGSAYGVSAHAAEARFSHAMRQARERLKI